MPLYEYHCTHCDENTELLQKISDEPAKTCPHCNHDNFIKFLLKMVINMRTQAALDINKTFINQTVTLCGWVHRRRDHGGLIFIYLRDRNELVQIVCDPAKKETFDIAQKCRNEFVIRIEGTVRMRPEGTMNADIPSGEVEIDANVIEILNTSEPLPFNIDDYQDIGEEVRLKYRYLDLRRKENQARLKKRAEIVRFIRRFLDNEQFNDIETPF